MIGKTCQGCLFWSGDRDKGKTGGQCRHAPPKGDGWPATYSDGWCGSWTDVHEHRAHPGYEYIYSRHPYIMSRDQVCRFKEDGHPLGGHYLHKRRLEPGQETASERLLRQAQERHSERIRLASKEEAETDGI